MFPINTNRPIKPIFIIGAPRSGTSILTWSLGQHPNIQPMPETSWLAGMAVASVLIYELGSRRGKFSHLSNVDYPFDPFARRLGESADAIVHDVFETRCQQFYGDYRSRGRIPINPGNPNHRLQLRRSVEDPKARWVDGTPLNTHFVWALDQLFPESKFIHSLRRPDEVALSLEGFDRAGATAQRIDEGLQTWLQHTEAAWLAERFLGPDRVLRIEFDQIESAPDQLLREILEFLHEPFDQQCLIPLERKINSSEMEVDRNENLTRIRRSPAYFEAATLYERLQAPVEKANEAVGALLKERVLSHCATRDLL